MENLGRQYYASNLLGYFRNYKTGLQCVIKKIFKSTITEYAMEKQLLIELEALKRLNHNNLIKTYSSFTD